MKGKPKSSASICPKVDLPAPRKPTKAMLVLRVADAPSSTMPASAMRARRNVASSRCSNSSRISSHSGDWVVTSPNNSASELCSACATCHSSKMETLPSPYSKFARCRSDTPAVWAKALRVMPRRARKERTRSPKADRKGFLSASVDFSECGDSICNILLDIELFCVNLRSMHDISSLCKTQV